MALGVGFYLGLLRENSGCCGGLGLTGPFYYSPQCHSAAHGLLLSDMTRATRRAPHLASTCPATQAAERAFGWVQAGFVPFQLQWRYTTYKATLALLTCCALFKAAYHTSTVPLGLLVWLWHSGYGAPQTVQIHLQTRGLPWAVGGLLLPYLPGWRNNMRRCTQTCHTSIAPAALSENICCRTYTSI